MIVVVGEEEVWDLEFETMAEEYIKRTITHPSEPTCNDEARG